MNDKQVMHALSVDDAYVVQRVLARGEGGVTELVVAGGEGPFVRKKMTRGLVRRGVWSALLDCDCPRLPHIENIYQMPDEFVVVYDFIPGKSLRELVAERGRLPESEVISLGLDLCEAAGAVHELGIIHRDITPKNVVVSGDGAHLIDFGIARMYTEGASRDTNTLGTYGFASPEQYGFEQTDARSDVYSIGRVLGYLLTGIMPNDEGYREALLDESVVSDQMRAIVERACAMEPSARYQSAAEFAAALRGEKNAEAAGDEAGDKAVAETAAAAGARPARRGAVIFQRSGHQNRSKRQKNDGTPGGNVTAARTSRRPKWVVVLAEAMVALAMVATLLVFLARNGVIPQWGAADSGPTPTWGASYKPGSSDSSSDVAPSAVAATGHADNDDAASDILKVDNVSWRYCAGWVYTTYSVTNTSSDKLLRSPTTTATARDASGNVVGSSVGIFSYVFPGQTLWDEVAVTDDADVATVTVTPETVEDWEQTSASADDASVFSVLNTTCKTKPDTALSVTGEVACQKKSRFAEGQIGLAVLLKDASGSVVASQIVMTDYPADGGSSPFEAYILDVPEFDTYEVYPFDM